jgi:hypothetical protein
MLRLVQVGIQTSLLFIAGRIVADSDDLQRRKPGKQIITFLLVSGTFISDSGSTGHGTLLRLLKDEQSVSGYFDKTVRYGIARKLNCYCTVWTTVSPHVAASCVVFSLRNQSQTTYAHSNASNLSELLGTVN